MATAYPSITVIGANGVRATTYRTPGNDPQPVLRFEVEDAHGYPIATMNITGLDADVIERIVSATRSQNQRFEFGLLAL